jgi:hypothetical protein
MTKLNALVEKLTRCYIVYGSGVLGVARMSGTVRAS